MIEGVCKLVMKGEIFGELAAKFQLSVNRILKERRISVNLDRERSFSFAADLL